MVGSHTQTLLCLLWTGPPLSWAISTRIQGEEEGRGDKERDRKGREQEWVRIDREGKGEEIWFHLQMCFHWAWRCWTTTGALLLVTLNEWQTGTCWSALKWFSSKLSDNGNTPEHTDCLGRSYWNHLYSPLIHWSWLSLLLIRSICPLSKTKCSNMTYYLVLNNS